jgi:hypothetical protein
MTMTRTLTRSRSRARIVVAAVASLLTLTPLAPAAIISTTPENFAALSGSSLSTGSNVTIGGNVGAIGDLYFNNHNVVTGNAYSRGSVQLSNNTTTGNVIAGTSAYFNNNATAGTVSAGTTIGLENNAATNSLRAGTSVSLNGNNATVNGSVNAGTSFYAGKATVTGSVNYGSSYYADSNASITGPVTQGSVLAPDSWSTTLRTSNLRINNSTNSLYYAPSSTNTLAAGRYAGVNLDAGSTLTLSAGTYNFSSLYLSAGAKILANTSAGNVIINIASTVSTASNSLFGNLGTGSLLMQTGGDLYMNANSRFEGSLISYSTMTLDQGTIVTGSVYSSGAMYLNNNVNIGGAGSLPVIPEPASVSLLLIGGAALLLRRPARRAIHRVTH